MTLVTTKAYRNELPRLYELYDLIPNPAPANAYFQDFDRTLAEYPQKLRQFRDIEADLSGLDPDAWAFLKAELMPLLTAKHETRGWMPLFDRLNETKAYNYLKGLGCSGVKYIPRSLASGQQTPDLSAELASVKVLCEVKTINISEIESTRRHVDGVGTSTDQLDDGFFRKLLSDLSHANAQMLAYCADSAAKRFVYVIVNFDDGLHEYADRYRLQISKYLENVSLLGLEIVFDVKPAFYAAMS